MNKELEQLRNLDLDITNLKARKEEIKQKALEHRDTVTDSELNDTKAAVEDINKEIKEKEEKRAALQAQLDKINNNENKELRGVNIMPGLNDKLASMEYREAFMKFVTRNEQSPILETRTDQNTTTGTAATVIPSTLMNEIIKEAKTYGNILPKVRKLNVKGGVIFPTLSTMPEATWISESTKSDRKKLDTSSISFSYYGLEVKIAQTLLSEYTSIEAFEAEFAKLAVEAMVKAKEKAIINGDGAGKPKGIFQETGVNEATIKAEELVKYDKLIPILDKLPAGYRAGAELYMADATWTKIKSMVDSQGQPVARVNYGVANGEGYSFNGYKVNIVETDIIKDFDSAIAETDFVIMLGNLSYYAINGNGDLGIRKYRDEENNVDVTKALEFLDGKPLQPKAFLRIKKTALGK